MAGIIEGDAAAVNAAAKAALNLTAIDRSALSLSHRPAAMQVDDCYRILGLGPGASADAVKQAYRDLVKVWHPDRFAHDPRLQEKAQEKLKEINAAYETLKLRLPVGTHAVSIEYLSDSRGELLPSGPHATRTVLIEEQHTRERPLEVPLQ